MKRLPPYGRRYLRERPANGAWIACGPGAWDFTQLKPFPVMVLPEQSDPVAFRWPVIDQDVLLVEAGTYDTGRLQRIAQVLLESGARMVLPIRTEDFEERTVYWRSERDAAA
jgi:hypothetical protein